MPEVAGCLKCQRPISEARRADSWYCSQSCKLAAEYERRRIQRRLELLEVSQTNARMYRFPKRQLERIQAEIDQAEGRLRVLLGASQGR
jgi:hypothetical protein